MKISKLFHWLYAVIMLLPVFAIGVTCGYAMFNKNAYQSYAQIEKENVYNVTSYTTLVNGNTYTLTSGVGMGTDISIGYNFSEFSGNVNLPTGYEVNGFMVYGSSTAFKYHWYFNSTKVGESDWFNNTTRQVTFKLTSSEQFMSNRTALGGKLQSYYQTTIPLDNVFYYAVDKVQQSPLFNWAENSFLVAPFAYIVALFSMPTNSPIVMLLSYWLAISIIWLVFDLIMYVPLLTHRWIDKGMLE